MSENKNGNVIIEAVNEAIEKYGTNRDELIPILNELNRTIGYLPKEALEEVSKRLQAPKSQLFSAATFYHMLSVEPRGRHVLQFCESAPCHVVGGREVWQALQDELHLESGQTSTDGRWTLITTSCLGACGVGPLIVIDEDMFGNVQPNQVKEILDRYE